MKKRLFPLLIALSALAVSGSAAFYSVFGLSKLFAGASLQVIIMAGSLEFAKLVVASLLYQYWDTINKFLRAYLAIACFVLMIITSGGIYGFLSGAYQKTATESTLLDKSLMILNQKQIRFEEQKEDLKIEKQVLTKSISDLRIALSNPAQIQYIDKESGTLITTSSSSARRALQNELTIATSNRNDINLNMEAVMDSINVTDMALLNKEISNEAESELGPLKYLAETTGYPMNQVVNWFLLLIIFVFDPLAIALVVASNMAFAQIRNPTQMVKMTVPESKEFNKPYPSEELKTRVKENQDKLKKETGLDAWIDVLEEEEEIEKRMNVIGQNGNDGLHYKDEIEKVVEINKEDGGHSIVTIPKVQEDIYLEQSTKPDGGRTPNPIKKKLNNL
tara:strand:+ start:240 stop:1415 length:1176 start_codon:yes stop_codon:yes gene_type:complete